MTLDLVDGILFLAPGFLAIKVFHLFGAQRPHSQWEWTVWSIVISLPIVGAAGVLRPYIGGLSAPQPPHDSAEIALRMAIGATLGLLAAGIWLDIRGSHRHMADHIRRVVGSSAWDQALEDVQRDQRQIELVLADGESIIGTLCYGGREDNEAEGWVYLMWPESRPDIADPKSKHRPMPNTEGLLVHRDQIKRIRMLTTKAEGNRRRQAAAAAAATAET
jgi:hypothetical protein